MKKDITVGLAGNPNSGKTTLFNSITGLHQHVGNYPGVTVENKHGSCRHKDCRIHVVDLPGTYSLTAYSAEELVARNYIINEKPDVLLNVVDASNLERNLYLTTQLIELGVPLVIAFNMSDLAEKRGLDFDLDLLSSLFGVPIVPTVGHKQSGINNLLDAALKTAGSNRKLVPQEINYGKEIEQSIKAVCSHLKKYNKKDDRSKLRWTAIKLLENDSEVIKTIPDSDVHQTVKTEQARIESILGDSADMIIADHRYGFISGACQKAVRSTVETRHTRSDKIDEIVIHRLWGLPIFLGLMYFVFWLTFTAGSHPMDWIDAMFGWLGNTISSFLPSGSESLVESLIVDGIIAGVGGVIIFLPNILILFLAIAILEDSGYMARAAFLMDRLMHKIGLHGKSFIPMLTGFGCSIPAIMATRTLENRRDRLTTMLVIPLVSCGARLPIYALIIPAFFPESLRAPILWMIYLLGIILAIICAKLLRSTLFKGESAPFVMELPPYRIPTVKSVFIHTWERGKVFLIRAGSIIFAVSVLVWLLDYTGALEPIGRALAPVLAPCGFGQWQAAVALIFGFLAKETVVGTLGTLFAGAEEIGGLGHMIGFELGWNPIIAYAFMAFCLIYMPCLATMAVIRRETGSRKWTAFAVVYLIALAWIVAALIYQIGRLFV